MKYTIIRILLFIGLLTPGIAHSQIVNFVQYGVENGMAQSQVECIAQDDLGQLWIGTPSGLSKYDGNEFINYSKDDSLAEDWITAAFNDSRGNMWFGHWGGSITKWDTATQDFKSIKIESFNSYQQVSSFVEDTVNGILYFSTIGSGLFAYDLDSNNIRRIKLSEDKKSKFIVALYVDDEHIWIGTETNGIYVLNLQQLADGSTVSSVHLTEEHGLSSNFITDFTIFDNHFWVSTKKGLTVFPTAAIRSSYGGSVDKMDVVYFNEEEVLGTNRTSCLQIDNEGNLWIGTENQGVIKCVPTDGEYAFRNYGVQQGLSFYNVKALFLDRENSLWIGTDVGINQYISDYFLLYNEELGITNNIVWSITPDREGNIWLGTNEGVSQLINADNIDNDELTVGKYNIDLLSEVPVLATFQDSEGTIWFGTSGGNLFKRTVSGQYERVKIEARLKDVIYSITEDKENNIWLGTRNGAVKLDRKTSKLSLFTEEDGLGGNNVYKVLCGKDGTLWFAVLGGNLTSFSNDSFKIYGPEQGLNSKFVLSMTEDTDGNLWFGCYTGGLFKYDGKTFKNYTKADGLHSETPYAVVADKDNNIWLGTIFGIEKFNREKNTFELYTKADGFPGVEVNPNSIAKDNNGNLWFGTILGAVKYNPFVHKENKVPPVIVQGKLTVNNEDRMYPADHEFLQDEKDLTFDYRAINLVNSNKTLYQYKLEGPPGAKWSEPRESGFLEFNNLSPGNYRLLVRGINSDNAKSTPHEYVFSIETPFYQSWLFYFLQLAIIFGMLALAVVFGRKTGGSRTATILASIAIIIVFEYGINYVEDNVETVIGGIIFIKVGLNALLGLILFPVERLIKKRLIGTNEDD